LIGDRNGNWYSEPIYGHDTEGRNLTPPQETVGLQEPALKELISFLFITGCTSSPKSLGLFKKVKIDKAVKSSKTATQSSQNVSHI
jgi:hypothetical protein